MNEDSIVKLGKHILYNAGANLATFFTFAFLVALPYVIIEFLIGKIFNVSIGDYLSIFYEFIGDSNLEMIWYIVWSSVLTMYWDAMRNNITIFDEDTTF